MQCMHRLVPAPCTCRCQLPVVTCGTAHWHATVDGKLRECDNSATTWPMFQHCNMTSLNPTKLCRTVLVQIFRLYIGLAPAGPRGAV